MARRASVRCCASIALARSSLAAAALLVFLVSWDEFAYALLLQVTNRPLPPLLYYYAAFGYPGMASAVAAVMLVPALLIVIALTPAIRAGALGGSGR
jgi:ABC-type spermidine/putrescine transport system permease subunit II